MKNTAEQISTNQQHFKIIQSDYLPMKNSSTIFLRRIVALEKLKWHSWIEQSCTGTMLSLFHVFLLVNVNLSFSEFAWLDGHS